jgi:hypothetical protein
MNRKNILREAHRQIDAAVEFAIRNGSHRTYREIARDFSVSESFVVVRAKALGLKRKWGKGSSAWKFKHQKES